MPKKGVLGTVIRNKSKKTITVFLQRKKLHFKYKKIINKFTYILAHDELNICKVGDLVLIEATRPISKNKNWILKRIIN